MAALAVLAVPAVASADNTVTVSTSPNVITLTSDPGDVNDLDITNTGGSEYRFDENNGGVETLDGEAGTICSQTGFGEVTCDFGGQTFRINVDVGDQSDTVDANTVPGPTPGGSEPLGMSVLGGTGDDLILTGGGNDILVGGLGADTLDGNGNPDTVDYSQDGRANHVEVDLSDVDPDGDVGGEDGTGDILSDIENIVGTEHDDVLTGSSDPNDFEPGFGADTVDGLGAVDNINYFSRTADLEVDLSDADPDGDVGGDDDAGDSLTNIEDIASGEGDDDLTGTSTAPNFIIGNSGNDTIVSGNGGFDDPVVAGPGDDVIDVGDGSDGLVQGDEGDDTITGGAGNDTIDAGPDADPDPSTDDDVVDGGADEDDIQGGFGTDNLNGGPGDDRVDGEDSNDNATIVGVGTGLTGGAGDDTVSGGPGDDSMDGGADTDLVTFEDSATGVTARLDNNSATGEGTDALTTFENLQGSDQADVLRGDGGSNELDGLDENDEIAGFGGDDEIIGSNGIDQAEYEQETATTANLTTGTATNAGGDDTLDGVENLVGSPGDDSFTGNSGENSLIGEDGEDTLVGLGDDDTLLGRGDDDLLEPGAGEDEASGGDDNDTVTYANSATRVFLNLDDVTDPQSGAEADTVEEVDPGTEDGVDGVENAIGSNVGGADFIVGDPGANLLEGGGGFDTLSGRAGADELIGGADGDTLKGEAGNDTLQGGSGNDEFAGGADTDTATYANAPAAITLNLELGASNDGFGGPDGPFTDVENAIGTSSGGDDITGTDGPNNIDLGGGDNDFTFPKGGDDVVNGGAGTSDGVLYNDNNNATPVTVNLATGLATGRGNDTLAGFERMNGSQGADTLIGDSGPNNISALNGNDTLQGRGGNDSLSGGNNTDTVSYANAAGPVTAQLGPGAQQGSASNDGDGSNDTFNQIEALTGSQNADTLTGNGDSRLINALGGNDILQLRNAGPDVADCGAGTDRANTDASDTAITACEKNDGPGATATPQINGSDPGSGANNNNPTIQGSAPSGSTVSPEQ